MEKCIDLNEMLIHKPVATFMLRVEGDSMIGAGIHNEGLLVVDRPVVANAMNVHISTSPFDGGENYHNGITMKLPFSTDDTRLLSSYAQSLLSQIFKPQLSYQRGGVLLMDLE